MENKQVEEKTSKNLSTSSKYARGRVPELYLGLAAAMAAKLMIGFWFGIGVVLAVKTLESLARALYKQKMLIKWQKKIK